jgi:hypothetical protein
LSYGMLDSRRGCTLTEMVEHHRAPTRSGRSD